MTGTDIREALHAVAESTPAPAVDRVALQALVRRERRLRVAERTALGAAVAAAVAVVATVTVPFLGESADETTVEVAVPPRTGAVDLQAPVYLVADGRLTAIDPGGKVHDLGVRSEEVIGYTAEFVYAIDSESHVVRFDATNSDEGPGGWRFERVDTVVEEAVQSAQLSADGRYLGWIDLEERLTTTDLKAGTTSGPLDQPGNTFLVDLAQGSGHPLVSWDGDLALLTPEGRHRDPDRRGRLRGRVDGEPRHGRRGATGTTTTRVYDVSSGRAELVDSVPGAGVLSPYGDHLASVAYDEADTATALLWSRGIEPVVLGVPGQPQAIGWADDDTVLVSSAVDGQEKVYACEVADPEACALLLEPDGPVRFAR